MTAPGPTEAHEIEAIKALKARYFRTLDQQDWEAHAEVFTPDVQIDVRDDAGADATYGGTEEYLAMLRPFLEGALTVHHGHTPEIELVDPDTATGIWAMEDHIWFPEATGFGKLWGSGWYEEQYRRGNGEWRIASMRLRRQRVEMGGSQIFPRLT